MDPRMMNQWLAAQSQKKQLSEADMQRKRLGIINEGGKLTQDEEAVTGGGAAAGAPEVGDMGTGRRNEVGAREGASGSAIRPNIYNPKINAEDAAVERISKDVMRGKGPDYAGEIDRTRIRMPRGSILDARPIGQMSAEQMQEAMMDGYCAAVSKKKI